MNAPLRFKGRNPDVLSCIANLSNDEVFTPPDFANRMLDTLAEAWAADHDGADLWADPNVRFLDPCTKSGVFLREIASRLIKGLEPQMPNLRERVEHVLAQQVFGVAVTTLTALLARRSLYCSKLADGDHSVVKDAFDGADGNVWFERTEHSWDTRGKCTFCGASQSTLDRGEDREAYAYPFIHTDDVKARLGEMFGDDMQFDVVIGNPPYQLSDGGHGTSSAPIYHHFIEQAISLSPRYAVFVTPSRWMTGGKGLDDFRAAMISDRRLQHIVDYPKLYETFPGVKIRGGVSYFVWNRNNSGPCTFETMWDGERVGASVERYLDDYDVVVRRNEAVPILDKVLQGAEAFLHEKVSARKPFGFPTNFHGRKSGEGLAEPVKLFGSQRISWINREQIERNVDWVDKWKVLMTRVQGTSAAIETKFLSKPIVAEPGTACSETYLVAGVFDTQDEANRYASYLSTKFARFLVSLRKVTQDAARGVYGFIPDLPMDRDWNDELLYEHFKLTQQDVNFIESIVAAHDD